MTIEKYKKEDLAPLIEEGTKDKPLRNGSRP